MRNDTREKFDKMLAFMASTYAVTDVSKLFAAAPSIEQRLMDKIIESSAFLQSVNVLPVTELKGEKILGFTGPIIGKRTNTEDKDRKTSNPLKLDAMGYECKKTEYDIHMKYSQIDAWAKFPDFYERFMKYVRKGIALGRIKAGFFGEFAAEETDVVAHPNGEDVNRGWVQILREYNAGSQFLDEGDVAGELRLGGTGDFANLDHFVYELLQLLNSNVRESGDLVAIIGRDLMSFDKTQLYKSQGETPTEKERIENSAVTRTYGGLPSMTVDNFPARGLMVTSLDNLSLYYQEGAVRQKIEDNAKRDRVEHFNTMNEDYVIENEEKAAAVEFKNVKIWNGTTFG